jgi:hypothetical protein
VAAKYLCKEAPQLFMISRTERFKGKYIYSQALPLCVLSSLLQKVVPRDPVLP